MSETKKIDFTKISQYMCVISVVLVVSIFTVISPQFLTLYSIQNLLLEMAPLLLMSGGITFVLFTGGIDLSTGAIASCTCVLTGLYIDDFGISIILLMLLFGFFVGVLNGFIVTRFKLPSFIVTLCTTNFWKCIALVKSEGASSIIPLDKRGLVNWASENMFGIPIMFWLSLIVIIVLYIIQQYTVSGRTIFAVGANVRATRMAGVDTNKAQMMAFIICGVCSALAGVFYAYKLKSSVPTVGDSLGLMAISSVALGGTSMAGGKGSVLRTMIGVITVTVVNSGMNMVGVPALWKDIVMGFILIIAVFINSDKTGKDIIIK